MDLKYQTQESIGNDEVRDSLSSLEIGEISPLETGDGIRENGGEISPPEAHENGCNGIENNENMNTGNSGKKSPTSQNESPEKSLKHRKATIMVAGRPRNGKSTALNNLFGLDLVAKTSAKSVTQVVNVREVTRKVPLPKFDGKEVEEEVEVTLRVIDTPGLGATDIPKEEILKDMKKITVGEDYILMYCFCVAPNQIVMDTDENIVKDLQQSLGKEVWNKCVLLFTFSDVALLCLDDSKEYIEHINGHATAFQNILNKIDPTNSIVVKTIFDYQSPEKLEQDTDPSEIVVVPVNKKPKNSKDILPGILKKGQDWTEIVFVELMKKTSEEERTPFIFFRYPNLLLGTSAAGAGAAIGAAAGAAFGFLGGPVGVAAGAALGAVLGAAAVSATGFTVKGVISLVSLKKKQ